MGRKIGAEYKIGDSCVFTVWAPFVNTVEVIVKDKKQPIQLEKDDEGYWSKEVEKIPAGSYYKFRLNKEKELPDPASLSQPKGVHSWSKLIDQHHFKWQDDNWKGLSISEMLIYELHVGTFTAEGTFEAVMNKLAHLQELGINTIEIMPVASFPGSRNWGYDGVYPFAAQESYGGAEALKKLINACHQKGIAVVLDAVYNHMGPEGNYLGEYGPYFTEKYHTPWGKAINFDDKYSDPVRNYFLQNALMWLRDFHFDGLRLDAIHEIIDRGAKHFLKELSEHVDALEEETGRSYVLIAESDLNDTKIINSYEKGGFGLEGQWVDDFHHSLHTLLTGENDGYYGDYGTMKHLAKSFQQAFVYDGVYSSFRKKTVGNSPAGLPSSKFVVCIQNHDQVGNRMVGERLSSLVSLEKLKLGAGIMLISPFVPMLFMGEEFAEDQPFQYFVSHGDPNLVKAVQEGRKKEFEYFNQREGRFPDPQSEETFNNSKINWQFTENPNKKAVFEYYKKLIQLRKQGKFNSFRTGEVHVEVNENQQFLKASSGNVQAFFNFGSEQQKIQLKRDVKILLASADKKWNGSMDYPEAVAPHESLIIAPESIMFCES